GPSFAAGRMELRILSGKPEMVSGGSALVELRGASLDHVRVMLNGQDVTTSFRPGRTAGTLVGNVDGLKPGANIIEAGAAKLRLVNHPIGGPVFSGPHQQPFICQTELSGLGKAVDDDCNAPTHVQYFYKSTERMSPQEARKRQAGGAF